MSEQPKNIHLFSSGFEWDNWQARNCDRCIKNPTCELQDAIFSDELIHDIPNGSVTPETAEALGYSDEYIGVLGWPCKERQTDAAPPTPAAVEMKKAGVAQLPGFDDVPERPADGDRRPSWTA